jgi:hypothetical protein
MATWTSVDATVFRRFPSLVTPTRVPVSAARKFAPVRPRSASANRSARYSRANRVRSWAVSRSRSGSKWCSNRSAISSRLTWMAGPTMWLGASSASWTTNSPRSVSQTSTPSPSSASLTSTSSLVIDLLLTATSAPASSATDRTYARASAASSAR